MLCLFGQDSWETVGKKKSVGKEGVAAETKERRVDKEGRGRGGPNRRVRGASRTQEGEGSACWKCVRAWLFF